MADKNPLRYRGYYYDTETGFYYLQSRYYDPTLRRFLNADAFASTGQGFAGTNMFAYCNNTPVGSSDPTGHSLRPTTVVICDGCVESKTTYDREAALAYVHEWFNKNNPAYPNLGGGRNNGDCTNFVSQALCRGGYAQTSEWYCGVNYKPDVVLSLFERYRHKAWDWSLTWSCADLNYEYVLNNFSHCAAVKITYEMEMAGGVGQKYSIQPGDTVYFEAGGKITHAGIVSKVDNDMIYYAGHSKPRYDCSLIESGLGGYYSAVYVVRID